MPREQLRQLAAALGASWPDRMRAAEALAVCGRGSPEAVAALEAALQDGEKWVRKEAQQALDELRKSEAGG
jgi:HEAT repeat protein